MSDYTWRELERADMDTAAAHAADMEYRAEQIAREVQKRLARMEHIVNGLGEVRGEIVRCRDCKYYGCYDGSMWCSRTYEQVPSGTCDYQTVEPNGFCAGGERNDGKAAS